MHVENTPHVSRVGGIGHDGDPAFEGGHLEERDVGVWHLRTGIQIKPWVTNAKAIPKQGMYCLGAAAVYEVSIIF